MLINKKSPHGGDIYTNRVRLDFSANLNPAGTPPTVVDALQKAAETCAAYPDPYCTALRDGIASVERVPAQTILCGNGAAELIYAFAYALPKEKPALIVSPTFCEYETALTAAGIKADHYVLKQSDGFRVTEDFFQTDFASYCAVFLCSPNNPTGITVKGDIIRRLAETENCVIVGRCANFILKDQKHVVNVYVHAPEQYCVRTVMNLYGIDREEAEKRIHTIDKRRSEYYKYFTGKDWRLADSYDLCIDSSRMDWTKCIQIVKAYLECI